MSPATIQPDTNIHLITIFTPVFSACLKNINLLRSNVYYKQVFNYCNSLYDMGPDIQTLRCTCHNKWIPPMGKHWCFTEHSVIIFSLALTLHDRTHSSSLKKKLTAQPKSQLKQYEARKQPPERARDFLWISTVFNVGPVSTSLAAFK